MTPKLRSSMNRNLITAIALSTRVSVGCGDGSAGGLSVDLGFYEDGAGDTSTASSSAARATGPSDFTDEQTD